MLRFLIYAVLLTLLMRALGRFWRGMIEGMSGRPPLRGTSVQQPGVHMVRDPVCGTFIVPERAVVLAIGREHLYFCSPECRDTYRARPSSSSSSGRPEPAEGRTA